MFALTPNSDRPARRTRLRARLVSGIDLMIDLATLGEYGLAQPLPAEGPSCEAPGQTSGWEAPALLGPRRGSCGAIDRLRAHPREDEKSRPR